MLEVSNWGLFAIMLVFVFFGGFAGGWNTGYKWKEREAEQEYRKKELDDDGEPLVIPEAWKRFND